MTIPIFSQLECMPLLKYEKVNQILCCITWRPDWADEVIELANKRRNNYPCAVVAVDIAAGEEHFDKVRRIYSNNSEILTYHNHNLLLCV